MCNFSRGQENQGIARRRTNSTSHKQSRRLTLLNPPEEVHKAEFNRADADNKNFMPERRQRNRLRIYGGNRFL
jgi:hypothetical protein